MNARLVCCALGIPVLVLVYGCGSKDATPKAQAGPPALQVAEQLQKLLPGLELKPDAKEGLADLYQTQISKQDDQGLILATLNHKGHYKANGPVTELSITFRRAYLPAQQDELLRYTDGLMQAIGYTPADARRIAEQAWQMPNPQKDGNALSRVYVQDGDYLAIVDGRQSSPPYVDLRTIPKGTPPPKGAVPQQ
jgi:hypothetical protein